MRIKTSSLSYGKIEKGASNLHFIGSSWISYNTQIAEVSEGNKILLVNPVKYSKTTSKQMSWVKRYYERKGYMIQEW